MDLEAGMDPTFSGNVYSTQNVSSARQRQRPTKSLLRLHKGTKHETQRYDAVKLDRLPGCQSPIVQH